MSRQTPRNEFEMNVIANAVEWTAVRGRGKTREVRRFQSLADAREAGTGDGRTMIYAIDQGGLSAHVENV